MYRRSKRRTKYRRKFRRRAIPNLRYFKQKCTHLVPITAAKSEFGFAWLQRQAIVSDVFGHNSSQRFSRIKGNYEQYAVTGMSIKYIPTNYVSVPTANGTERNYIGSIFVYDDMDTFNTLSYTENQFVALDSFRVMDPTRPFKLYRSCKKLARQ